MQIFVIKFCHGVEAQPHGGSTTKIHEGGIDLTSEQLTEELIYRQRLRSEPKNTERNQQSTAVTNTMARKEKMRATLKVTT